MTKARDLANAGTALTTVSATELGYLDGVTSAIQTQLNTKAPTSTTATLTGIQTLTNKTISSPTVLGPEERLSVTTSAATGTVNLDVLTAGILYSTSNATGNWTLNVRGDGAGTTLNTALAINDSITVSFLVTNGSTAYRHTALTIDGSAQTVLWSGGTAPAAGNASSIDAYSFTIIKTASATYTVLGAGPIKYA